MTKSEKIQEAYGEYWDLVKDYVDENGWIKTGTYHNNEIIDFELFNIELESDYYEIPFGVFTETIEINRPKSLNNIEYNEGWIVINNYNDLPKENDTYFFVLRDNKEIRKDFFIASKEDSEFCEIQLDLYTHYQPITKPNPPIY